MGMPKHRGISTMFAKFFSSSNIFWSTHKKTQIQKQKQRRWRQDYSDTVMPTKSDSDVMFCLQLLSKTLTCTLHLS